MEIATIGCQAATVRSFLETLQEYGAVLLIDIRAAAGSRRPGFAKTALAANLRGGGIDYLHLRGLGTPAEGRAAARAGRHCHRSIVAAALSNIVPMRVTHLTPSDE